MMEDPTGCSTVWPVPFVHETGLGQTRFKVIYLFQKERQPHNNGDHPTSIIVKEVR